MSAPDVGSSRVVVLAGGQGRRLRPYTLILPKPLLPIADMPILEILIRQLARNGFRHVSLASGYLAGLLQAYFGDGSRWGVEIEYTIEEEPLVTAGPLSLIEGIHEPFVVTNGDVLSDIGYRDLLRFHRDTGCLATVAVCERNVQVSLGVLDVDETGTVRGYTEKPKFDYLASMGIYAMEPDVLRFVPTGKRFDLPDLIRVLIESGECVMAYRFAGYWRDLGQVDDYEAAIEEFHDLRDDILGTEGPV